MKKENNRIAKETDPEILKKLRNYNKLETFFCLECGYNGLMGVEKSYIPWYLTWWVLIPIFLTGVGIIPGILLVVWRMHATKKQVVCPSCDTTLITQS